MLTINKQIVDNHKIEMLQYDDNMNLHTNILTFAKKHQKFTTRELVNEFGFSRQYINIQLKKLIDLKEIIKIGATNHSFYVHTSNIQKIKEFTDEVYEHTYTSKGLEEHTVLTTIEQGFPFINFLPENIKSIFDFSFSEMLNNAIEHSETKLIHITITKNYDTLSFVISDAGIGVFRSIQTKKHLGGELEAIQELLKGKTTTMPRSHSGEGIFFTSKSVDTFTLESFNKKLVVDQNIQDTFIEDIEETKRGTRVICTISLSSKRHLSDIFKKYTNLTSESDHGFDKTEILIKLYTVSGIHISRSQARRIVSGLEKFSIIVFDYDKVPTIGQAFADEIYRVFHTKYPKIQIENKNMNDNVTFMVRRAISESKKTLS